MFEGRKPGNWAEERAPPLKYHVFGDFGFRETTPQTTLDFKNPTSNREYFHGRRKTGNRFGMVTAETITEARVS